jgi:hypothetical protein
MNTALLSRIAAIVVDIDRELTTAAHAVGDGRTMLAATAAAERALSEAKTLIYDAHDAALGIGPAPLELSPAPAARRAA